MGLTELSSTGSTSAPFAVPLCVNLEGTLLPNNLFAEGLVALLSRRTGLAAAWRLLGNRLPQVKRRVAELAEVDAAALPYDDRVLDYLRTQRQAGRKLVLVTSADVLVARKVADHLGLFDDVIASDGVTNLTGEARANALLSRYGKKGYAYAGGSAENLPAFKNAASVMLVGARAGVRRAINDTLIEADLEGRRSYVIPALRAMRPYQWVKNLLVFVPIVTGHALGNVDAWIAAVMMFCAFCLTASGIYIVNDLADLSADRQHHRKRNRPIANGTLSVPAALMLAGVLLAIGIGFANFAGALPYLGLYALASILYSLGLKQYPLVDVFLLAGLYTLRIIAGGAATGFVASPWLLAFSGFLFLSLALVKRTEELGAAIRSSDDLTSKRRGYLPSDLNILQLFGCASAFAAAVVLALFVGSNSAFTQYRWPEALWGIVPLVLFWQCRIWLAASRGQMHDDPIVYAARDWVSWTVAASIFAVLVCAA
jgi:4-hydroxybenzoate polyprenyltransferase